MNKTELVDFIAKENEVTKKEAEQAVNLFTKSMVKALEQGEKVQLVGFGTFEIDVRDGRMGKNLQTGAEMKINPKVYPKFIFGKPVKDAVATAQAKNVKKMLKEKNAKKKK